MWIIKGFARWHEEGVVGDVPIGTLQLSNGVDDPTFIGLTEPELRILAKELSEIIKELDEEAATLLEGDYPNGGKT